LLIFGPERLPRAAADAAKWLKQIRGMASGARADLADSAGIDLSDAADGLRKLRDLHPRRLAAGLFDETPEPAPTSSPRPKQARVVQAGPGLDPDAT